MSRSNGPDGVQLHTVPLAQAVSISSSFLAVAAHNRSELAQDLASTEKLVNWGVLDREIESECCWLRGGGACFRATAGIAEAAS